MWNASTINGNMQRGIGIIQNELYAERLVWNKVRMDPDTPTLVGKSVLRIARIVLEQVDALVATGKSNGRGEAGRIPKRTVASLSPH